MEYKKYKKEDEISYSFGGFPTYELLKNKPHSIKEILIHEKLELNEQSQKILQLAKQLKIKITTNGKLVEKLSQKGNVFIIGIFKKYKQIIESNANHILLVNPSDMGNLGTIIRVMLGFDHVNLAIIKPCIDIFDPRVIRASMGSIFSMNIQLFENIEDYESTHNNHMYPFMLNATNTLQNISTKQTPYTLVFGNEAHGLDNSFLNHGTPMLINHSNKIDSLNLSMSVGIALYEFTKK